MVHLEKSMDNSEGEGMNKPVLHLNLKSVWFDMILSGLKKEEYREIKPYWERRFGKELCSILIKNQPWHPAFVTICFSNGYVERVA